MISAIYTIYTRLKRKKALKGENVIPRIKTIRNIYNYASKGVQIMLILVQRFRFFVSYAIT